MNDPYTRPPVIGFAARSGTGKTTLLTQLLPLLKQRGVRTGVIKHSHHDFEIDVPGKDSYRLRKAGAAQMLIASPWRQALIKEGSGSGEPRLEELLETLDRPALDLVLVEGFRHVHFPKIELVRRAVAGPFLHSEDESIVAVATDHPLDTPLPQLDLNDPAAIVDFILDIIASQPEGTAS